MPSTTGFETFPGFTEILDIGDPRPSSEVNPISDQMVGYTTSSGLPGTDPSADTRTGAFWTKRINSNPELEHIDWFFPSAYSQVFSVNNEQPHSQLAGWISDAPNEVHPAVFEHNELHPAAGLTLLIGLNGAPGQRVGGFLGQAYSLSDLEGKLLHVAGWVADPTGQPIPVRWTLDTTTFPRTQTIIPLTAGLPGQALHVHDNGSIVGWYRVGVPRPQALLGPQGFLWRPGAAGANPPAPKFTSLGSTASAAVATSIAADGTTVGFAFSSGGFRAFISPTSGPPVELPAWGGQSVAFDINDAGIVVGWAESTMGLARAAVWQNGIIRDLNKVLAQDPAFVSAGLDLAYARAINNRDQIVGTGQSKAGSYTGWRAQYVPQQYFLDWAVVAAFSDWGAPNSAKLRNFFPPPVGHEWSIIKRVRARFRAIMRYLKHPPS